MPLLVKVTVSLRMKNRCARFCNKNIGLTETGTTISWHQIDRKIGTVGGAGELIPGIIAKVVKPDGSLASDGERGELVVKGPSIALGYYGNPAAYVESNTEVVG